MHLGPAPERGSSPEVVPLYAPVPVPVALRVVPGLLPVVVVAGRRLGRAKLAEFGCRAGVPWVLDVSGVRECGLLGAGMLTAVWRRARSYGSELRLVAPSQAVEDALTVSGLRRLLTVFPDVASAVEA
ncbi:STAS domain-containing protein [Streptomyces sp. NPDC048442]|uniref:STAS domain-containing protein n=1 Tax=Streptomyces sp. NPDC048442 TaxID=3154823 RepID=UPI003417F9A0